ncbi:Glutamyl-tRNA(Gln) amidotransferase subunit C [Paraconexibacter sp. AEG42_29]|uniref:Aspartyl/glutamyl-tRNA(Asn/Gln) amidotransferase subunit C n=1 Tax=Paraconexibacter sp. AEG42_29 TaxID=2997339 RepID=A0AAU7AUW4_9ACTN
MIDRTQVLHVAKLARLQLTEAEVGQMSTELSSILGHIEKLNELDLGDVPPTAHVVATDGTLRPDEVRESLEPAVAFAQAPDIADDGFRVPSPQA